MRHPALATLIAVAVVCAEQIVRAEPDAPRAGVPIRVDNAQVNPVDLSSFCPDRVSPSLTPQPSTSGIRKRIRAKARVYSRRSSREPPASTSSFWSSR